MYLKVRGGGRGGLGAGLDCGSRDRETRVDGGVRDGGVGDAGVGPVGASAAGSGLEEEDECCPAEGERSDHLERCCSSAVGEGSESVWTHELERLGHRRGRLAPEPTHTMHVDTLHTLGELE